MFFYYFLSEHSEWLECTQGYKRRAGIVIISPGNQWNVYISSFQSLTQAWNTVKLQWSSPFLSAALYKSSMQLQPLSIISLSSLCDLLSLTRFDRRHVISSHQLNNRVIIFRCVADTMEHLPYIKNKTKKKTQEAFICIQTNYWMLPYSNTKHKSAPPPRPRPRPYKSL